jgi:DNA (cytosine-5)-methyltransferase 1
VNHLGLFSGIGGFEEAFRRAGAKLVGMCEIDPQAQRVLRQHFPGVEVINDVKAIKKDTFGGIPIQLITGGFPCQDLSVAGNRKGLDGERSGLWFEFIRIIASHKPRWVVIENVPGLLSGCGCFSCQAVGRLIRTHTRIRRRKGGKTCAVCVAGKRMLESHSGRNLSIILRGLVELGYGVAWRVFDSQFDGVAQRRERVFIVASLGDASCAEVLFEREGGAGDYPPSREAGERVAGTLNARASAGGGLGTDFECLGGLQPVGCRMMAFGEYVDDGTSSTLKQRDFKDATDLVVAQTLTASQFRSGGATAGNNGAPVNLQVAVFDERNVTSSANRTRVEFGEPANTLHSLPLSVIAFTERTRAEGRNLETQDELAYALTNPGSGGRTHSRQIAGSFGVRRLTSRECERLQGFADGHTEHGGDGERISDSARYRMLGNAVCLPTVEWIARRLMAVAQTLES